MLSALGCCLPQVIGVKSEGAGAILDSCGSHGIQGKLRGISPSTGFLLTTPKLCSMMICSWYSLIPTIVRGKQPAMSEESMRKRSSRKMDDELRPEYDFRALRVVARGPGRKTPHETTVRLASDVAETFPDSESVNEALRFLIRITKGQINTESRLR